MAQPKIHRRDALKGLTAVTATGATSFLANSAQAAPKKLKDNVKQSVSRWCFKGWSLDELCRNCVELGLVGIDLLGPNEWDTLKKYDLAVTMGNGPGLSIAKGFNHVEHHDDLVAAYESLIPQAAAKGVSNLICFSGNRKGMGDEEGIENCVTGLKRVIPLAEKHKVNLVMELLNSYNHKDYHADHTAWAAEIAERLGSDRFTLLYDIFHMQIMEGNLITTIRKYQKYIGHYHTGGVPGRHEIDDSQEIYYPAVIRAIVETGFNGYVAHEFIPAAEDKYQSLEEAVEICDV